MDDVDNLQQAFTLVAQAASNAAVAASSFVDVQLQLTTCIYSHAAGNHTMLSSDFCSCGSCKSKAWCSLIPILPWLNDFELATLTASI